MSSREKKTKRWRIWECWPGCYICARRAGKPFHKKRIADRRAEQKDKNDY